MKNLILVLLVALVLAATSCASVPKGPTYLQKISYFHHKSFSEVQLSYGKPDDRYELANGMMICEYKYRYSCGYLGCVCITRFMVGTNGIVEGGSYSGSCE